MIVALALALIHEVLKNRMSRALIAEFALVAQRGRQERLTRDYQRYLTAMA
jgi:hypothetical protein